MTGKTRKKVRQLVPLHSSQETESIVLRIPVLSSLSLLPHSRIAFPKDSLLSAEMTLLPPIIIITPHRHDLKSKS